MQGRIGIIQQRHKMVRAVLLEEKIVKIRVPEFPRMHQKSAQLMFGKIQAILPNIPVLDVPIFLNLQIIGNRRKVSFIDSKDALYRESETGIGRYLRGIVDGIGKDAGLFGLSFLIDTKQG